MRPTCKTTCAVSGGYRPALVDGPAAPASWCGRSVDLQLCHVVRIDMVCKCCFHGRELQPCSRTLLDPVACLLALLFGFSSIRLWQPAAFVSLTVQQMWLVKCLPFIRSFHPSWYARLQGKRRGRLYGHNADPRRRARAGMAGDRGMRYPELTAGALQHLALPAGCKDGYSTSRTCEVSLSNHSGVNFRGLVYLVDEATRPKAAAQATA